ncbi:MAG TPA: hypothetical protein VKB12_02290 [Pyrinomonadaceae bacterium]|nr:hypothetical protein [Pyrinomonadaceae bacterium]
MSLGKSFCLTLALCFAAGGAVLPANVYAKTARATRAARAGQVVTGTVVGISGRLAGRSRPFTLRINGYTTASDAERLNNALRSGGEEELMNVLSRLDAGRVAIGTGVGVPANAVLATPTAEGGTKLLVLFQRNIGFYELRAGTRSSDYRFGYAEIYLDRRGRGEGTFIPAAKIKLQGDTWVVEDFGAFPARLMGIRSSGTVTSPR